MATGELLAGIEARRPSALARAISVVEDERDGYESLLSALYPRLGHAHRIGITGPPGAGKSTLTERIIQVYRARGCTVAVVAVDPTSPFSGGALLGDRIRMESVALDPGVFIRSMATRGQLGGVATTTREVCDVLDAFGFDRIVIETVGVGQSELTIAAAADTAVLVLVPESGDGVQVLKAGVMEIADIFAINKADRPGADRLRHEIEVMLGIRRGNAYRNSVPHHHAGLRPEPVTTPEPGGAWEPPVLATCAVTNDGVVGLVDAIERHAETLRETGLLAARRRERLARHTRDVVERNLRQLVWRDGDGEATLRNRLEQLDGGAVSPYEIAQDIVAGLREDTNGR
ncbi:MAG TPA: methylmalonyl Co-A mutase-associated GTPase MeaB [Gemmatimonadales bacterium]